MDINYELYKVFYYVASTLSFSEASKQLFISQSLSASRSRHWRRSWIRPYSSGVPRKSVYYRRRDLLRHIDRRSA